MYLRSRTFLLFLVQGKKGNVSNLDNLKPYSGNITNGVTLTTESCNQNFIVLFNAVETTVPGYERRDLLSVLDQLYPNTLPDSRVRLLGFNTTVKQDTDTIKRLFLVQKLQIEWSKTLTLFLKQFPWRGKLHRKDQPSISFQDEPFCSLCRSSVGRVCGSRVYVPYEDHEAYL